MSEGEAFGVLPRGEAEIARVYDEITGMRRAMDEGEANAIQSSGLSLLGWAVDGVLLFGMLLFLLVNAAVLALPLLLVPAAYAYDSWQEYQGRLGAGDARGNTALWAIGPFSRMAVREGLARWTRANRRSPAEPVDATSLDVLEPVARHLAGPILARARAATRPRAVDPGAVALRRVERRRGELLDQARDETDPVWKRAAEEQAGRLAGEIGALERRRAEEAEALAKVLAGTEALEAYLDRLSERRRLLAELRESRASLPEETAPTTSGADEIRANLAGLAESLRTQEAFARERASAELEMRRWERGE